MTHVDFEKVRTNLWRSDILVFFVEDFIKQIFCFLTDTAQKMKSPIKDLRQKTADLVTFTGEILIENFIFCAARLIGVGEVLVKKAGSSINFLVAKSFRG